jgi:cell division protein FtsB
MSRPIGQVRYSDSHGRMTIEGIQYFDRLARDVEALRAEVDTLKTQVADHETRITALEP